MISPSRGIHQGDPFSPFLFLLYTEGLHGLISQAANEGDIKGYSLCRNSLSLTHLLFVDNSLFFFFLQGYYPGVSKNSRYFGGVWKMLGSTD